MPSIKLTWDAAKHLFSFPVMILLPAVAMTDGIRDIVKTDTVMYVDSGSTLTSITEIEAQSLGIDLSRLERQSVAGVNGISETPITRNLVFVALSSGDPLQANLEKVAVLEPALKRKIRKGHGVFAERGFREGKMFCLCGLDLIEKWHGKLHIDMVAKSGFIEIG